MGEDASRRVVVLERVVEAARRMVVEAGVLGRVVEGASGRAVVLGRVVEGVSGRVADDAFQKVGSLGREVEAHRMVGEAGVLGRVAEVASGRVVEVVSGRAA